MSPVVTFQRRASRSKRNRTVSDLLRLKMDVSAASLGLLPSNNSEGGVIDYDCQNCRMKVSKQVDALRLSSTSSHSYMGMLIWGWKLA